MNQLNRIKKWLSGASFTQLMETKKTNKYRIAKNTGISYQTLLNWEACRCRPTDKSALAVAGYLGLISSNDMKTELQQQAKDIKAKLGRLA